MDCKLPPGNKGRKRKGTNRLLLEQEGVADPQYLLLHADIAEQSKILGFYLGKRLHAKYSQVVSSKLQGQDGFAILDLVPCSSSAWKAEQKETLLGWFLEEIQQHLESVEAIKPTFSQVNMRKVKDTLMDEKNAPPLTYSFLKALNGKGGTLFPYHTHQSYQLLETAAGIPVSNTHLEEYRKLVSQPDVPVLVKKMLPIEKKKHFVKRGFLECVPHLVSECTYFALIEHLVD